MDFEKVNWIDLNSENFNRIEMRVGTVKKYHYHIVASKLYGVNATIIIFMFVLYCILYT